MGMVKTDSSVGFLLGLRLQRALGVEVRGEPKAEGESRCLPLRESHRDAKFEGNRNGDVDTCHSTSIQSHRHNKKGPRGGHLKCLKHQPPSEAHLYQLAGV